MKKIKAGDDVIAIAGKDKGKRGKVLAVLMGGKKVLVEGLNMVTKCVKANPETNEEGGFRQKATPIDRSNVMLYDGSKNKRARVGIRVAEDGKSVRYFKGSNELIQEAAAK